MNASNTPPRMPTRSQHQNNGRRRRTREEQGRDNVVISGGGGGWRLPRMRMLQQSFGTSTSSSSSPARTSRTATGGGGGGTNTSSNSSRMSPFRIPAGRRQQQQQGQPYGHNTGFSFSSRASTSFTGKNDNSASASSFSGISGAVVISNVDEALGALRSQHTFETEFPIVVVPPVLDGTNPVLKDDEKLPSDSSGGDDTTTRMTPLLSEKDDRDEQDPEILRSIELLKQLNYYQLSTASESTSSSFNNDSTGGNNNDEVAKFTFTEEEEMELLAKTGSVWGQQSFQFATFPPPTSVEELPSEVSPRPPSRQEECSVEQKEMDSEQNNNAQDQQQPDSASSNNNVDPFPNLTVPSLSHRGDTFDNGDENDIQQQRNAAADDEDEEGCHGERQVISGFSSSSSSSAPSPSDYKPTAVQEGKEETTGPTATEESSFEQFWTSAVNGPTPSPSPSAINTSSTYANTPTTTLSAIVASMDNNNDTNNDNNENDYDNANGNDKKHHGQVVADDDDFGDFQEADPTANATNEAQIVHPIAGGEGVESSPTEGTETITANAGGEEKKQDDEVPEQYTGDNDLESSPSSNAVASAKLTEDEVFVLSPVAAKAASTAAKEQLIVASGTFVTRSSPFPFSEEEGNRYEEHHDKKKKNEFIGDDNDQIQQQPRPFDDTMMKTPNTSMIEDDDDDDDDARIKDGVLPLTRTPPSKTTRTSPIIGGGYRTPHMTPEYIHTSHDGNDDNIVEDGRRERVEPPTPITQNRSNTKPNRTGDGFNDTEDGARGDQAKDDVKEEDDTGMDAFVNMVAMVQKDYDLSPTRPDRRVSMDGGIHDHDDDEEDASDGSQSFQSRSIPSVVQLFTNSSEAATAAASTAADTPAKSSTEQPSSPFVVPRTVRLLNPETDIGALAMTPSPAKVPQAPGSGLPPRPGPSTAIPFSPPSASRIRMIPTLRSSFYSFSTRRSLDSTYNTPALVEQFEKSHKKHTDQSSFAGFSDRSVGAGDGSTADNRSLPSSIASPEAKFFRRKNSKPLNRKGDVDGGHRRRNSCQPSIENASDHPGDEEGTTGSSQSDLDEEENRSLGSMSSFPEQFWRYPEKDPTVQELKRLEWDWLPYWQMDRLLDERMPDGSPINVENVPLLQEQITERLSKLDSLYDKVRQKAHRRIQPHSESLQQANRLALDLQRNIQLAQMYLNKSQNAIRQAYYGTEFNHAIHNDMDELKQQDDGEIVDGLGVLGAVKLLELSDTQDAYDSLKDVVDEISAIYDLENTILTRIEGFDTWQENATEICCDILRHVEALAANLDIEPANQIRCLDELRGRVPDLVPKTFTSRLHSVLENTAMELCLFEAESSLASKAYSRLLEVMIMVHQESGGQCDEDGVTSLASAFCTTVQTAFLLETQKAFGIALLDPVGYEDEVTSFAQELFASRHNQQYLDATRIPSWTYNLVTIRFDLELQQQDDPNFNQRHPLPAVFHKLCYVLAEVLHGMHRLITWRPKNEVEFCVKIQGTGKFAVECVEAISNQLNDRRASIWNASVQALENCLDEWLQHVGKLTLFQRSEQINDDFNWFLDLDSLQRITWLTDRFLSLESDFLRGVSKAAINDGSMVHDKLHTLYRKHLRTVHIEAMNTTGGKLYNETWLLSPIAVDSEAFSNGDGLQFNHILKAVSSILNDDRLIKNPMPPDECNTSSSSGLVGSKNPFEAACFKIPKEAQHLEYLNASNPRLVEIMQLLEVMVSSQSLPSIPIATDSLLNGVLPWISRLLAIMTKIPSLIDDVTDVVTNIFDLYTTTVFRLCAGSSAREKFLLGLADATNGDQKDSSSRSSSPMFGLGLGSQSSTHNKLSRDAPVVPAQVEGELCALTITEADGLASLSAFLMKGQRDLQKIAKLDYVDNWVPDPPVTDDTEEIQFASATAAALAKRQAAAWSCVVLAIAVHVMDEQFGDQSAKLRTYSEQVLQGIPAMVTLCQRVSCMRSIRGKAMILEILSLGPTWEESKLHEQPNDYVDFMCEFMSLVWASLCDLTSNNEDQVIQQQQTRLPRSILNGIWETFVGCGYMILLDGFSRVPFCSTEGRALMSMDLRSYFNGISTRAVTRRLGHYRSEFVTESWLPDDSEIRPFRSTSYVDTYTRIFYFPPTDALNWILENYKDYHQQHMISLLRGTFFSSTNNKTTTGGNNGELNKMISDVVRCYDRHQKAAAAAIGGSSSPTDPTNSRGGAVGAASESKSVSSSEVEKKKNKGVAVATVHRV
eukprot:CAMPEP_0113455398 /NCGR_PEP_ID=MMETSP0014_2-20120614/8356_1 /TAXON_ID=2857 /ORGANISM="Nitzschia sp." /LENGTH=2233 /DNA_ID=CAMNT_0000346829 /DNA_START=293 /DNA_END=6994 /DNA_ORIENTATION=- /assembly_acc=CAM_ASM_000159